MIESLWYHVFGNLPGQIILGCLAVGLVGWGLDQLVAATESRVSLDARQRAWLLLAEPYFGVQGFRSGDLAGTTPLGRLRIRTLLRKDWGIRDSSSARARLDDLLVYGHRSDPDLRDPNQPAADLAIVDRALLAWDGMRVIFVARCCFAVGHLDAATTWNYVWAAIRLVRDHYASWREWGRSFAAGRALWSGDAHSYYTMAVEKLLTAASSPWNRTSWQEATRI